jgi:hypothetical protein
LQGRSPAIQALYNSLEVQDMPIHRDVIDPDAPSTHFVPSPVRGGPSMRCASFVVHRILLLESLPYLCRDCLATSVMELRAASAVSGDLSRWRKYRSADTLYRYKSRDAASAQRGFVPTAGAVRTERETLVSVPCLQVRACLPAFLPFCLPAFLPACLPFALPATCLFACLFACLPSIRAGIRAVRRSNPFANDASVDEDGAIGRQFSADEPAAYHRWLVQRYGKRWLAPIVAGTAVEIHGLKHNDERQYNGMTGVIRKTTNVTLASTPIMILTAATQLMAHARTNHTATTKHSHLGR